jgi:hypothetical protein
MWIKNSTKWKVFFAFQCQQGIREHATMLKTRSLSTLLLDLDWIKNNLSVFEAWCNRTHLERRAVCTIRFMSTVSQF